MSSRCTLSAPGRGGRGPGSPALLPLGALVWRDPWALWPPLPAAEPSPFLFFSLVTTVMDMVGVAEASPLPGSLLTCRDRKVHLSVFLAVGGSFFSASLFLSVAWAAVQ